MMKSSLRFTGEIAFENHLIIQRCTALFLAKWYYQFVDWAGGRTANNFFVWYW